MDKKNIIIAVVSGLVLIASLYFMYVLLFPAAKTTNNGTEGKANTTKTITGKIDDDTLKKIKTYKDYGGAALTDIGRVNPFGPLN